MGKKKSVKKQARVFKNTIADLRSFTQDVRSPTMPERHIGLVYEAAIIKLHCAFERLLLHALVGAVNNDTTTLSKTTRIRFPKHLTDAVCEYIITGGSYFSFHGRDGLLNELKKFLPASHYLVQAVAAKPYKHDLDRLFALRNFAAHESPKSKKIAKEVVGVNLGSAGSWLKRQQRFAEMTRSFERLADDIEKGARY